MPATEPTKVPTGESSQEGSPSDFPPDFPAGAGPLAELGRLLDEARTLGGRIFADACVLAHAQWRLSSRVVTASASVLAMRALALLVVAGLLVASWVFLNVGLWRAMVTLSTMACAPPLALVALNLSAALIVLRWQKGLRPQ